MDDISIYEARELVGHKVVNAYGTFLGTISSADESSFKIARKLFGFGPVVSRRKFASSDILTVNERCVKLKPYDRRHAPLSQENWDEEAHRDHNYFIL